MSLKVSKILHAGLLFQHHHAMVQTTIAFDPIFESPFSENCYSFPAVKFQHEKIRELKWDAVFISHYHDDHFSLESLRHIDRNTAIYMFCVFDQMFELLKQLGFKNVNALKLGEIVRINTFEVICHPALDVDVDCVFQIKVAGLNILNVVDSWIADETFENLKKQKPWDLVLWPFQLMREIETLAPSRADPWDGEWPIEWKNQLQSLSPRVLIPSSCQFIFESWSWLNSAYFPVSYSRFEHEMSILLPYAQVLRLDPAESVVLDLKNCEKSQPLSWIQPLGAGRVDYQYNPDLVPQPTSDIAKHFPELSTVELKAVHDFCESGLVEKLKMRELLTDEFSEAYFQKGFFWKLSLYDHQGFEKSFYYKIKGSEIQRVSFSENINLGWSTEISVYKLYRALFEGESLTSLYLRINACVFENDIEIAIKDVDVMNDPLLRSLFDGQIASYQTAQLKRLPKIILSG